MKNMTEEPLDAAINSVEKGQGKRKKYSQEEEKTALDTKQKIRRLLEDGEIDKAYEIFKSGRLLEGDTHTYEERILSKSLYLARPDIAFDIFDNSAIPKDELRHSLKYYLADSLSLRNEDTVSLETLLDTIELAKEKYQLKDAEIEEIYKNAIKNALGNMRYDKFLKLAHLPFITNESLKSLKPTIEIVLGNASSDPEINQEIIAKIKEIYEKIQ